MAEVKKFIEKFSGQAEERDQAKREVSQLVTLATAKLDVIEARFRDMFRNRELEAQLEIVGDRMGAFSREYRVNYSDGDISNAVKELVESIMLIGHSDTRTIVCKVIENALHSIFASVSATEESKRLFIVILEGVSLVRYDIEIWKSAEQDSSLFKHCQSVVAITYARSVIDHTKVSEDELNDAIFRFLGSSATIDDIITYKKKLLDLLKLKADNDGINLELSNDANDMDLIPMLTQIPVDEKRANEYAAQAKETKTSKYVATLLEEQKA